MLSNLDSLNQLLYSEQEDSIRQNIILKIIDQLPFNNLQEIEKYKKQYVQISEINNEAQGIAEVYKLIGEKYLDNGKTKEAAETFFEFKEIMAASRNQEGLAYATFLLGTVALEMGAVEDGILQMNESLQIYKNLPKVSKEQAGVQNYLGIYHRNKGNYNEAKNWFDKSLQTALEFNDSQLESSVYNNIGRLYRKKAVYDSAHNYYLKSLEINERMDDKKNIASSYNNLGNIAQISGDLEKALSFYITSLEIKEELGFPRGIGISYHNIGAVRFDLQEFGLAKKDFEKSLEIASKFDYKFLVVHNFLKLGNVERELGNVQKAIELHLKAIKKSEELNFEQGQIEGKAYLGEDYFIKKDFGNALDTYQSCLAMAEKNNRKNYISISLVYIAKCFMGIQELTREGEEITFEELLQNRNIESLLLRGTRIAKDIDAKENMTASFQALQEFYRSKNEYQKEAQVSREYMAYRDSIFELQRVESIAEWSTKYETAEKEKEISLLEKEKELQEVRAKSSRNKLLAGMVLLLIMSGAGLIYFNLQNQMKRRKQIESLRTKISSDLHDDVGSMLSGLAMQAELLQISMPEADQDKLLRISTMGRSAMSRMRDAVWAMDARKDKFSDLLDRMNEFAEETLVQADIAFKLNYSGIDQDKIIMPDVRQSIYLIFKESLTNIIKHAEPTKVVISLTNSKDDFCMSIKNDGVVPDKNYKSSGLGTSNMKMRAESIGGSITFDKSDGFEVLLKSSPLS